MFRYLQKPYTNVHYVLTFLTHVCVCVVGGFASGQHSPSWCCPWPLGLACHSLGGWHGGRNPVETAWGRWRTCPSTHPLGSCPPTWIRPPHWLAWSPDQWTVQPCRDKNNSQPCPICIPVLESPHGDLVLYQVSIVCKTHLKLPPIYTLVSLVNPKHCLLTVSICRWEFAVLARC